MCPKITKTLYLFHVNSFLEMVSEGTATHIIFTSCYYVLSGKANVFIGNGYLINIVDAFRKPEILSLVQLWYRCSLESLQERFALQ